MMNDYKVFMFDMTEDDVINLIIVFKPNKL